MDARKTTALRVEGSRIATNGLRLGEREQSGREIGWGFHPRAFPHSRERPEDPDTVPFPLRDACGAVFPCRWRRKPALRFFLRLGSDSKMSSGTIPTILVRRLPSFQPIANSGEVTVRRASSLVGELHIGSTRSARFGSPTVSRSVTGLGPGLATSQDSIQGGNWRSRFRMYCACPPWSLRCKSLERLTSNGSSTSPSAALRSILDRSSFS